MPTGIYERKIIPLIDRISLDVKTGCWNWRGLKDRAGYGRAYYRGKNISAHRLSAHLWLRMSIRDKRYVCHRCDNPACFNPKHLFLGTALDNARDSMKKGRPRYQGPKPQNKTHCPKGHPYDSKNTYLQKNCKCCRTCHRERQNASYYKEKKHGKP